MKQTKQSELTSPAEDTTEGYTARKIVSGKNPSPKFGNRNPKTFAFNDINVFISSSHYVFISLFEYHNCTPSTIHCIDGLSSELT